MRRSARVILVEHGKVLLLHRIKNGKEYYVVPGGGIEEGETPEQTAVREMREESSTDISNLRLLWETEDAFFFTASFTGTPMLSGPEVERQSPDNQYMLEWVPVNALQEIALVPEWLKAKMPSEFRGA
ncbi:TPA: NUDIX domain-containing protein [Candidatus Woesearchaeota archaeon]|nr:NUDIX domain-containing protein [Candidatus Woesearchaeota archaeon]